MRLEQNIIGRKYNMLTIVDNAGFRNKKRFVEVKCECGNVCVKNFADIKAGKIKSCNCFQFSSRYEMNKTHGLSYDPLMVIYKNMKSRCYDPKSKNYNRYGFRGISICKEWLDDVKVFYDWCMLNNYQKGLQIDRINNDGNYEPSNCRWVTSAINNRNTCRTRLNDNLVKYIRSIDLTKYGSIAKVARELNVSQSAIGHVKSSLTWK